MRPRAALRERSYAGIGVTNPFGQSDVGRVAAVSASRIRRSVGVGGRERRDLGRERGRQQ